MKARYTIGDTIKLQRASAQRVFGRHGFIGDGYVLLQDPVEVNVVSVVGNAIIDGSGKIYNMTVSPDADFYVVIQ